MSGAEFRERRWSREDRTGPDRGPCPARRREIQDHAQDRPGRRAVSNTHSRRRAERACRGSNLIGRRASMGASIDAQCGAEACRVACDRKGDSDWRQINVTKRALPSPFKSEVPVLPGPPYNKINGLPGPLATLAAAIGDSREQRSSSAILARKTDCTGLMLPASPRVPSGLWWRLPPPRAPNFNPASISLSTVITSAY